MIIKSDARREPFERQKVLNGLIKACEKRPISLDRLDSIVTKIELFPRSQFLFGCLGKIDFVFS